VLREALQPLAGKIASAFVYGSIARGDERPGSDVDVMVVGSAGFADVVKALAPAQEALRREINPHLYEPGEFDAALREKEPFLRRVMEDKKIYLVGGADDAREPSPDRKAPRARRRQG
jgi:predicted nucleotidyltransferase